MNEIAQLQLAIASAEAARSFVEMRQRVSEVAAALGTYQAAQQHSETTARAATANMAAGFTTVTNAAQQTARAAETVSRSFATMSAPAVTFKRQMDDAAASLQRFSVAAPAGNLPRQLDAVSHAGEHTGEVIKNLFTSFNGAAGAALGINQSLSDLAARFGAATVGLGATTAALVAVTIGADIFHLLRLRAEEANKEITESAKRVEALRSAANSPIQFQVDITNAKKKIDDLATTFSRYQAIAAGVRAFIPGAGSLFGSVLGDLAGSSLHEAGNIAAGLAVAPTKQLQDEAQDLARVIQEQVASSRERQRAVEIIRQERDEIAKLQAIRGGDHATQLQRTHDIAEAAQVAHSLEQAFEGVERKAKAADEAIRRMAEQQQSAREAFAGLIAATTPGAADDDLAKLRARVAQATRAGLTQNTIADFVDQFDAAQAARMAEESRQLTAKFQAELAQGVAGSLTAARQALQQFDLQVSESRRKGVLADQRTVDALRAQKAAAADAADAAERFSVAMNTLGANDASGQGRIQTMRAYLTLLDTAQHDVSVTAVSTNEHAAALERVRAVQAQIVRLQNETANKSKEAAAAAKQERDAIIEREFDRQVTQAVHGAITKGIEQGLTDGVLGGAKFWQSFAALGRSILSNALSDVLGNVGGKTGTGLAAGVVGYDLGYSVGGHGAGAGALTGAAGGAIAGAVIGSVVPVVGTAIGAALGGLAGAVGGLIGAHGKARDAAEALAKAHAVLAQWEFQRQAANAGTLQTAGFDIQQRELALAGQDDVAAMNARFKALAEALAQLQAAGASDAMLARLRAVTEAEWQRADALAAEQKATQRTGFANTLAGLSAQASGDDRTTFLLGLGQQSAEAARGFGALWQQGVISFEEMKQALGLLNTVTEQQTAAYDAQVAHGRAAALVDAQARTLAAQGHSREADDLRIQAQYEDQLAAARQQGADVLAAVIAAQRAETEARRQALAIQQRTDYAGFQSQLATLEHRDRDAFWINERERVAQQIDTYARLRDAGTITDVEFEHMRTLLLDELSPAARIAADSLAGLQMQMASLRQASDDASSYFSAVGTPTQDQADYYATLYGFKGLTHDQIAAQLHDPTKGPLSDADRLRNEQIYKYFDLTDKLTKALGGGGSFSFAAPHAGAGSSFFSGATAQQVERANDLWTTAVAKLGAIELNTDVLRGLGAGGFGFPTAPSAAPIHVYVHNGRNSDLTPESLNALADGIARGLTPNAPLVVSMTRAQSRRTPRTGYRGGDAELPPS